MLEHLRTGYHDLQEYAMPYYEHYSTSLSPYKVGFISGYERCCAYVADDEFRKNLDKALLTVALTTFLGTHLLNPVVIVPAIALSLSKIYLLSHSMDYLGIYLAQQAKILKESDPNKSASYILYSGLFKSISDTILISGMATTFAAPIVGALSHVQFQLAYNIMVPSVQALIRTIGFELSKAKDAAFDREVKGDDASEYLLKAVLIGAGYKVLTSMLGGGKIADLLAFVAARSLTTAFMAAEKDITQMPKHLWEGLNSSVGFCAQYFLLGFSEKLIGVFCESSTSLSAIAMRSVSMNLIVEKFAGHIKELSKEPVAYLKAYYLGTHEDIEISYKDIEAKAIGIIEETYGHISLATKQVTEQAKEFAENPETHLKTYYNMAQENVKAYYKGIEPKAKEIVEKVYGHASRAAERALERIESTLTRQP